ncbi:hypothetical protein [Streptomyces nigra]|uniref:hypothetical protein n=1 Tax=Streptomyces nigra TaxID=1827580 RepID=UPI0036499386
MLRHDQRLADMAGGNDVSESTVRRWLGRANRTARRPGSAPGRAPVEHSFAHLKNWRILTKLRTEPARATQLLRALLVLTNLEVNR